MSLYFKAYKLGLYGRKFQWIQWDSRFGIQDELSIDINDGCTHEQILAVAEGILAIRPMHIKRDEIDSMIGETGKVHNLSIACI